MDPFNEVDNVVLCVFCYAFIGDCVPADGSEVTVEEVCTKFFRTHSREEIRKSTSFIAPAPLLMDYMIAGTDYETRGSFTESIFTLFEAAGKDTVDEILGQRRDSIRAAMAALRELPVDKRRELRHLIHRLARISRHERYKNYLNRLRSLGRQSHDN